MSIEEIIRQKKARVWEPVNIYPTAKIGIHVNIGMFSEIGDSVIIGNYCRIGAMCFLCTGVELEDYVFLGPHVIFTHDKYFPSGGKGWEKILVKHGARIGGGCIILPGVTIGENAMIGAGSIVTKDVPAGETWCGSPAKKVKIKAPIYNERFALMNQRAKREAGAKKAP